MLKSKILISIVLPLLFLSCSDNKVYDKSFYTLLNEILSQYDSTSVVVDTPKNYKVFKPTGSNEPPPPPSSVNSTTIMYSELAWLQEDNYLTESDVIFMLDQTTRTTGNRFDTTRIKYRTINKNEVDKLYQKHGASDFWEKIYTMINSYDIIFVSKPLFNSNTSKMYFQIEYFCGGLCGYGMTYLCEKRTNEWKIILQILTWES